MHKHIPNVLQTFFDTTNCGVTVATFDETTVGYQQCSVFYGSHFDAMDSRHLFQRTTLDDTFQAGI